MVDLKCCNKQNAGHECSNQPKIVKVKKIIKENYKVKTFFLDVDDINLKKIMPGQFMMVWLHDVDEKPFAVSYNGGRDFAISVEEKGNFTKSLFKLSVGDKLGVRGPYGKGFSVKKNALVVAGGLGMACVAPLIDRLEKPVVVLGAKTKDELLFTKRFKEGMDICTDDGGMGYKGFVTEYVERLLKGNKNKFSVVYTCGPEVMMMKIFDLCEKYGMECEASLERYMSCGFGVCARCCINDKMVCQDGPVFSSADLRKMSDFGKSALLKSGKKVSLNEYYSWRS